MSSGGIKELKERISTVSSIQRVSKVMEITSRAKIPKYKKLLVQDQDFHQSLREAIIRLIVNSPELKSSRMVDEPEEINTITYVLVTSDMGMVGSYNNAILKSISKKIAENSDKKIKIFCFGEKGHKFVQKMALKNENIELIGNMSGSLESISEQQLRKITEATVNSIREKRSDIIEIFYTSFVSSTTYEIKQERILPIRIHDHWYETYGSTESKMEYEGNAEELLGAITHLMVDSKYYHSFISSLVSEQYSRNIAMEAAHKSSIEMMSGLSVKLNLARKAKITQEINEIVSGFESSNNKEVL